jgi:hypothetical protein
MSSIAGAPAGALAHPMHRLLLERARRGAVAHQRLVERRAGVVGERGAACRGDRGRARRRGLEVRGPRQVFDDVQQVVLAALEGRAVPLDQPAALGQFAAG